MADNPNLLDDHLNMSLVHLSPQDLRLLERIGLWSRVFALGGITLSILFLLSLLAAGVVYAKADGVILAQESAYAVLGVYGLLAGMFLILNILLYQFAKNALRVARQHEQAAVGKALNPLKKLVQIGTVLIGFFGVIMALVFYANALDLMRLL